MSLYRDVDVPNPMFVERDVKKIAEFDAALKVSGLAKYLSSADSSVKLGTLKIKNNSRIRSKAIEISASSGAMFKADERLSGQELQKQITIQSLDGLKEANIVVVSSRRYTWENPPVQLIYDDRTLEVGKLPDFENAALFAGGSNIALIFAGLGLIAVIFLVAGILYSITIKFYPDIEIKNMTDVQVAKMLKQIERIKKTYPEKLPKNEAQPPSIAN